MGGQGMPLITVKWVEGHNQERRDKVATKITDVVHETTGIPKAAIWVVFEDVKASDWYTDATSVAVQRGAVPKK
jgi:4-oxalocrotonate tautomerase